MILIADSNSSIAEWAVVNDDGIVIERAETTGLNPFFQTRRDISHIIRLELPESFFRNKYSQIFFYGPGCLSDNKKNIVSSSLVAQFHARAAVESDLMGAARGLLLNEPGLACILSVGANSCLYDGKSIVKNVRPGGYLLGDEGSNCYLGKQLVSDILKELAPNELQNAFYDKFQVTPDEILDLVYTKMHVNLTLGRFSSFLAEHLDHPYCWDLVYEAFMTFFRRNIAAYDYRKYPLAIVGSAAYIYREVLYDAALDFGVTILKIERSALEGLVKYHVSLNTGRQ